MCKVLIQVQPAQFVQLITVRVLAAKGMAPADADGTSDLYGPRSPPLLSGSRRPWEVVREEGGGLADRSYHQMTTWGGGGGMSPERVYGRGLLRGQTFPTVDHTSVLRCRELSSPLCVGGFPF